MELYKDLLSGRLKIAYIHIPKTGGRTFRAILHSQLPDCKHITINNPTSAAEFSARKPEDIALPDLIEGHFGYDFIPNIPRRFQYFSLMRNPVDRVISQYNHLMRLETNIPVAPRMRRESWSLLDFVKSNDPEALIWVNAHAMYLGGIQRYMNGGTLNWNELFERAVLNMVTNFQFIAILEKFDEGLIYLKEAYGFKIHYQKEGVTPATAKTQVDSKELEVIRQHLKPDIELYNLALKMLDEKLKKIENLTEKVATFRQENRAGIAS